MPGMHGGPQPPGPHPSGMMMNRPPMPQQPQMPGKVPSTIKTNIKVVMYSNNRLTDNRTETDHILSNRNRSETDILITE